MTEETNKNEELEQATGNEQSPPAEQPDAQQDQNERYLRLLAEFDNFKKRTQKEKIQVYTSAAAEVIEAILPFLDSLERATAAPAQSEEAAQLLEGIQLIRRQFETTLAALGVTPIEALGQQFDPELHNAVMHVEDDSVEGNDIVVEEFSKGYLYKDKVIRHSTVKVAN